MIAVVCVDDNLGMLFNHRRQSRDAVLQSRILALCSPQPLWMNEYSARLFESADPQKLNVREDFLTQAPEGSYCFVETLSLKQEESRIEKLILYKWNRSYPTDFKLDLDLNNWRLIASKEFEGSSHPTITEEIYIHA